MVPQPVLAVLLLFPITPESEAAGKRGGFRGLGTPGAGTTACKLIDRLRST